MEKRFAKSVSFEVVVDDVKPDAVSEVDDEKVSDDASAMKTELLQELAMNSIRTIERIHKLENPKIREVWGGECTCWGIGQYDELLEGRL